MTFSTNLANLEINAKSRLCLGIAPQGDHFIWSLNRPKSDPIKTAKLIDNTMRLFLLKELQPELDAYQREFLIIEEFRERTKSETGVWVPVPTTTAAIAKKALNTLIEIFHIVSGRPESLYRLRCKLTRGHLDGAGLDEVIRYNCWLVCGDRLDGILPFVDDAAYLSSRQRAVTI
jgi:hypothetical protein